MANNYTPNYKQYLTQTAGYALPSSVRTYSVFDPNSNSWKRMTNDGRSPMQQGTQADIQAALRYADSSQGKIWDNPTPAQTPAQIPLGGPRMASGGHLGGGMGVPSSQPSASPRGASMSSQRGRITDYNNDDVILRAVDIPVEATLGTQVVPAGTMNVNMSPDYREPVPASTQVPAADVQQPVRPLAVQPGISKAEVVKPVVTDIFDSENFMKNAHRYSERDAFLNEQKRHIDQMVNASAMFMPNAAFNVGWGFLNPRFARAIKASPSMNETISPLLNRINTTRIGQGATRLRNTKVTK